MRAYTAPYFKDDAMDNECATNALSWDETCRRAGGRRHYNAVRQLRVLLRRARLVRLLREMGMVRGYQVRLAEAQGVAYHPHDLARHGSADAWATSGD